MRTRGRPQAVRVREVQEAVPEERREEVRLSLFLDALDAALSVEGDGRELGRVRRGLTIHDERPQATSAARAVLARGERAGERAGLAAERAV